MQWLITVSSFISEGKWTATIDPQQLIHVNLQKDQLSHLNLNLATTDPRQFIFHIFQFKNEIDITFLTP